MLLKLTCITAAGVPRLTDISNESFMQLQVVVLRCCDRRLDYKQNVRVEVWISHVLLTFNDAVSNAEVIQRRI
jgi:hypothetical protein